MCGEQRGTVKEISAAEITRRVAELCIRANYYLPPDVLQALDGARKQEPSPVGQQILDQLVENAGIA
jgi:fumarate hydratase subunit alpha